MRKFLDELFAPRRFKAFKKAVAAFLIMVEMLGFALFDIARPPRGPELDMSGYELVFEDEFEDDALDLTKWIPSDGVRRAGYMSPEQAFVEDGNLIMRVEHKNGKYGEGWYSSMMRTVEEYAGGGYYFECRCIASLGGGFWSAFWLNSPGMGSAEASNGGIGGAEVDIFEAGNYRDRINRDSVSLAIHVGGYGDGLRSQGLGYFRVKEPYTQFNTYGLEWADEEYIFYINGVEAARSDFKDGVSKGLEYVLLSLEIPSAGSIIVEPGFSTDFIVDYVRVYKKA